MEKLKWIKIPDITTTWRKEFPSNVSKATIVDHLTKAAKSAGVKILKSAFLISTNSVEYFNLP